MKREIIKLGLEIKAPLDLAWSCYEATDKPCGTCGPCYLRAVGFAMNGVKDSYEYTNARPELWEGCISYEDALKGKK